MGSRYVSYRMIDENGEQLWRTADGEEIPFSKVTHQHWSNIYWYHRYIAEDYTQQMKGVHPMFIEDAQKKVKHCLYLKSIAEQQIMLHFNGDMLDWVPKYENEKEWFKKQNTRKILIEKYKPQP